MGPMGTDEIVVGLVRSAHGLAGELLVEERTDDPADVFAEGRVFRVASRDGEELFGELTLQSARRHRGGRLIRFAEIADRTTAKRYVGRELTVGRDELRPLAEGEFFVQELVGFAAVGPESEIGVVKAVYEAAGTTILGIDTGEREVLVPFLDRFVSRVSRAERRIWIEGPEGLLEL